jgi:voltage-gated potassium channel Kch
VVAGLAATKAVIVLFRHELERLWIRLAGRGHVIVCGQGEKGWHLARSLQKEGWRVAGIDLGDPERPVGGWAFIPGDATDAETLRRAACQRADHLVALCGDDGTNAAVVRAASVLGGPGLTIHMLCEDPTLATLLLSEVVMQDRFTPVLEVFSLEGRAVSKLVDSIDPSTDRVFVLGDAAIGHRALIEVQRRLPAIETRALRPRDVSGDIERAIPMEGRSVVLACSDDEADALSGALSLLQTLKRSSLGPSGGTVEIIVVCSNAPSLTGLIAGARGPDAAVTLRAFDSLEETLGVHLITGGALEAMARAIHEAYREHPSPHIGASPAAHWEEADDLDRASSRAAAAAVAGLLREIDCDLIAAEEKSEAITFLPSETELLAMLEHDRWLRWVRERGIEPGPVGLDWFDLTEMDRARVSEAVGRLPAILLGAGHEVIRLEQSAARSLHDTYVQQRLAAGATAADNPSLVPWDRLHESLRDSNRDQVAHLRLKLRSIGLDLLPGPGEERSLSETEVEALARLEHDRWTRHRRFDGWTLGPKRDPKAKVSPYLVPWSELDEPVREIDRQFARSIPDLASNLGAHIGERKPG